MKKLLAIILCVIISTITFADGFTDPEINNYLDTAFPNQVVDGLVVVGRFNGDFGGSHGSNFKGMLESLVSGLSDELLEALSQSAQQMFLETFGESTPNRNWSVVIDINTEQVKQVFHARDVMSTGATNEEGQTVYTALQGTNQSGGGDDHEGFWSYSNMTGQSLGFMIPETDPVTGEPVIDEATGQQKTVMDYYKVAAAVNWSPIMFDLDMDGKPDTNRNIWMPHAPRFFAERTAMFDMSGDGLPELAEWLGPNDGLLVLPEVDGSVKSALNLFGNAGGYADGYEKMSVVLDLDGNGWIEKEELNGLYVWRDLNCNAHAEKNEMKTIQEMGIERISVTHKDFQSICYIKGKEVKTWDWWPACYELMKEKRK